MALNPKNKPHNAHCTCWDCPAINLAGKIDFRACGQSVESFALDDDEDSDVLVMAECHRRPELGVFDPTTITFEECPEWQLTDEGYVLKEISNTQLRADRHC